MDRRETELPAGIYLWLVMLPLVVQIGILLLVPDRTIYTQLFDGELGLTELGTAAALLVAGVLFARHARDMFRWGERRKGVLLTILAVGSLLFLGEEISWGQWFFGWSSPEWFQENNLQGETNLHNLDFVKKDIPKWIVILAITIGGLVLPFRRSASDQEFAARPAHRDLVPSRVVTPAAIVVLAAHMLSKLYWWIAGIHFQYVYTFELNETTELYIALFALLYAVSLRRRVPREFARTAGKARTAS